MEKELKYTDIFVPGGYPNYTYNPREALKLEGKVGSVLENLCKLVVVTGHTKSGKTVLVQKILPRKDAIWIDGGGVGSEDDLWTTVVDQLNLFQTIEIQGLRSTTAEISGEAIIEGNAIFAKGGAKIGNNLSENESSATMQSRQTSSKIIALKGLRLTKRPLVIDDFHYLPKDLQGEVVRAIKPLVYDGVPIVFIAIPHRRYDSVKVEREMTARMFLVDIPLWSSGELMFIPETGFPLMNVKLDPAIVWRLAQESLGSPHLMQEFCRAICRIHPNLSSGKSEQVTSEELEQAFRETAETIGRPIFEKLARGPRQRSDRLPRKLKDGEDVDIYELVLHGLAHIKPGLETIEYEDLRTAIKEICEAENVPQLHEIARVLKYMSEIAATDQSSTPVVDFDEADKLLHVTDPFFAFYLRWGRIG